MYEPLVPDDPEMSDDGYRLDDDWRSDDRSRPEDDGQSDDGFPPLAAIPTPESIRQFNRMEEELYGPLGQLRDLAADLEPSSLNGATAVRLLEFGARLQRLGTAFMMLAAPVVDDTYVWRQEGHKSAATFLAEKTGTAVGTAIGVLETARQLGDLPHTARCLRQGDYSPAQIQEIASAAAVHPGAEGELLDWAAKAGLKGLKHRCQKIKQLASWETGEIARYNAIRKSRFFRHWTEPDGAIRIEGRLTPGDGARLLEAVKAKATFFYDDARRSGLYESMAAYAADALTSLADDAILGTGTGIAKPTVVLRVDATALRRGDVEGDEVCEIPGTGPVPLATARQLIGDCFLKVVIHQGTDILSVSHPGRTIPAHLETALHERDRMCAVPQCVTSAELQSHHRVSVLDHGPTELANLVRICRWHHDLLTYDGWRLEGEPGDWSWHPPPDHSGP
ncbi:MAG: DUF222 domain-containing protein [Acidimicrobiales bacterium]